MDLAAKTCGDNALVDFNDRKNVFGLNSLEQLGLDTVNITQSQTSAEALTSNGVGIGAIDYPLVLPPVIVRNSAPNDGGSLSGSTCGDKKRRRAWYNVLSPSYKNKQESFVRLCRNTEVPESESLLVDYSCAYDCNKNGLLAQGRMYLSPNYLLFHSRLLSGSGRLILRLSDIVAISRERTAKVFPNAISLRADKERYFFTSFSQRDRTFQLLMKVWELCKEQRPLTPVQFWDFVRSAYGDDLGFTTSDDESAKECLRVAASAQASADNLSMEMNGGTTLGLPLALTGTCESEPDLRNFHYVGGVSVTTEESTGVAGIEDNDDDDDDDDEDEKSSQEAELSAAMSMTADSIQPPRCFSLSSAEEDVLPGREMPASGDTTNWVNCLDDHDHFEKQYVDTIVPFTVDELFTLLFTDSAWCRNLLDLRKTSDVQLPAWPEQFNTDGTKSRVVTYTLALNYAIGPKMSSTVEKQMLLACSKPGRIMVLNTEVENRGIPYAGNFYVFNRYCLTAAGPDKSRIRVCSKVMYTKTVFMMAKSMIESSAKNGLTEFFRMMLSLLDTEAANRQKQWTAESVLIGPAISTAAQHISANFDGPRSATVRRRKAPFRTAPATPSKSALPVDGEVPLIDLQGINLAERGRTRRFLSDATTVGGRVLRAPWLWLTDGQDRDRLVGYLLIGFALTLFVCFATLYGRLKELETLIQPLTSEQLYDNLKHMDHEQWQQLLLEQRKLQHKELLRWRDILDSTITTLHHMRNALLRLRSQIELERS